MLKRQLLQVRLVIFSKLGIAWVLDIGMIASRFMYMVLVTLYVEGMWDIDKSIGRVFNEVHW